jgi:transcription factor WhiB
VTQLRDRPEHRARQRAALDDAMFPAWTGRAKCAEVKVRSGTGGQIHDDYFKDELSTKKADAGEWPTKVVTAMRLCSTCPVRVECLRWAMDQETRFSQRWKTGELVEQDRRFGVYGGVPGRVRERYGTMPCPVCGGTAIEPGGFTHPPRDLGIRTFNKAAWMALGLSLHGAQPVKLTLACGDVVTRGASVAAVLEEVKCQEHEEQAITERDESAVGWPCTHCRRSGRVPRPDRIEQTEAFFVRFAQERRWVAEDREERTA